MERKKADNYQTFVRREHHKIKERRRKHNLIYKKYWTYDKVTTVFTDLCIAFTTSGVILGGVISSNYTVLCITAVFTTVATLLRVAQASFGLRDQLASHLMSTRQYSELDSWLKISLPRCENGTNGEWKELAQTLKDRLSLIEDWELPVGTPGFSSQKASAEPSVIEIDEPVTLHQPQ